VTGARATIVCHGGTTPPPWVPAGATTCKLDGTALPAGEVRSSDVALIDAASTDAPAAARRLRSTDAALHIVLVVAAAARPQVERALLFTPGVGEVWIVAPAEVDEALLDRAAEITRTRRSYEVTRANVQAVLTTMPRNEAPRHAYISDAYLAALLQVLPDPVLSIGDDSSVASWSPAAERVLRLGSASMQDVPLADIVRPLAPVELEHLLERGRSVVASAELRWLREDGEQRVAEVTVTPVDAAGQRVRAVVFRDITEQRAAQQQLEEQASELEAQAEELVVQRDELAGQRDRLAALAAERMRLLEELQAMAASRTRFYASMSHELRTPINAILGYNDLLLTGVYGELPSKQQEALQRAQSAAQHLRELVNDVLDLSKIESGKIDIVVERVSLTELVDEVVETIRPVAAQRGSPIEVHKDSTIELQTDPRRVRQILLNLLSNAVKFGAGQPVVARTGRLAADRVYVEVQDRGSGIRSDQIARIFEEFVQLEAAGSEGTGLGLAISRRLAVALGGSLGVASTAGVGSTFTLTLPLSRPHAAADARIAPDLA
jgi:PAS domain S-box-containing protein